MDVPLVQLLVAIAVLAAAALTFALMIWADVRGRVDPPRRRPLRRGDRRPPAATG